MGSACCAFVASFIPWGGPGLLCLLKGSALPKHCYPDGCQSLYILSNRKCETVSYLAAKSGDVSHIAYTCYDKNVTFN